MLEKNSSGFRIWTKIKIHFIDGITANNHPTSDVEQLLGSSKLRYNESFNARLPLDLRYTNDSTNAS